MSLSGGLENLAKLLSPRHVEKVEAQVSIVGDVWNRLLSEARLSGETIETEPGSVCRVSLKRLKESMRRIVKDRRTHAAVRRALEGLLSKLGKGDLGCPEPGAELASKVEHVKKLVEKLSKTLYDDLDCGQLCGRDKRCQDNCHVVLAELIGEINFMGFLLDTCYNTERFKRLYRALSSLLTCPSLDEGDRQALATLVVAATLLLAENYREIDWLYELLRAKLGLPVTPWLGDVAALTYATAGILGADKLGTSVRFNVETVGKLVAKLLECRTA
ncbi:hypothetical protein [Hyperthermus butylicus]|uniref:Uncharacterized protein n=1 Tax=Hyperthermus butylicus (strain DSM 5456 / JCM 9403 / PLM1-5) TaxID=415426 RepID=A2BKR0_HYPBU|nr:hypothetical protein [Hyperthermus butylicus]ABM80571.1 hypothetical protein Hbut_0716 [Hyperthermus butylicus DSM 5456]